MTVAPQPGSVARCSKGVLGVITGRRTLDWGESWTGVSLDGGRLWASRTPEVVAESLIEYEGALMASQGRDLSRVRYIALEGGGAKGGAEIPVVQAIQVAIEAAGGSFNDIEAIAGTSAGALLALLLVTRRNAFEVERVYRETDWAAWAPGKGSFFKRQALRVLIRRRWGVYSTDVARAWIVEQLAHAGLPAGATFADLTRACDMNLIVTAVDVNARKLNWYSARDTPYFPVVEAVLASMGIPMFYRPLKFLGRILVDGGMGANLPINYFKGKDPAKVIGVKVDSPEEIADTVDEDVSGFFGYIAGLAQCSISLSNSHISKQFWPDRIIRVPVDGRVKTTQLGVTPGQMEYLLDQGERAVPEWLSIAG